MGYIKLLNERVAALEAKQTEAEREKLRAARASALGRELQATLKESQPQSPNRAESPTYSDPTIEDATAIQQMLAKSLVGQFDDFSPENFATALKQAGFVRKVQP